jgi:4-hydroxybenzoate polyprenyltransferase
MNADPQVPHGAARATERRPGDASPAGWVDGAPRFVRPYLRLMRLDRPIGAWLLFWPCVFGLALGATSIGLAYPPPLEVLLCGLGAIVMRGAGCTYNDIVDRHFDAQVERTRNRPIPSGAVSVPAAWTFAIVLSLIGLGILLYFNQFAVMVGAASLALIAVYPFMKRITWWPQAWLGLTFNWGVPFGYAAMTGTIAPAALLFYAGCFFWTIGYDTIYAHQDKEDDMLIGVKSSAIRLGARSKPWLYVFYALAFALMIAGGLAAGLRVVFVLSMLVAGAHLLWQLRSLDIDRPLRCLMLFKSNRNTGALIAAALILGSVFGV